MRTIMSVWEIRILGSNDASTKQFLCCKITFKPTLLVTWAGSLRIGMLSPPLPHALTTNLKQIDLPHSHIP